MLILCMELHKLKENFDKIILKYKLSDPEKAEKISKFLTNGQKIDDKKFAEEFKMDIDESKIFLKFIMKGIEYKEENIDNNKLNLNK